MKAKKKMPSQREIAIEAGVHPNTVGNYHRGVNITNENKILIQRAITKLSKRKGYEN